MKLSLLQRRHQWVMRRLRPVFFLAVVYARDLEAEQVKTPLEGFVARFVYEEELLELCHQAEPMLTTEFVEGAMARNDVCTGMFYNGNLVAYMWRSTSTAPHTDAVSVESHKPYRYGYKALTLKAYRGQHIPEYLSPVSNQHYIEKGYTQNIGFVETHNYASHRSEIRRGSYVVGYAGYFTLFKKVIAFRTKGVLKTGFKFVPSSL